MRQKVIEDF